MCLLLGLTPMRAYACLFMCVFVCMDVFTSIRVNGDTAGPFAMRDNRLSARSLTCA